MQNLSSKKTTSELETLREATRRNSVPKTKNQKLSPGGTGRNAEPLDRRRTVSEADTMGDMGHFNDRLTFSGDVPSFQFGEASNMLVPLAYFNQAPVNTNRTNFSEDVRSFHTIHDNRASLAPGAGRPTRPSNGLNVYAPPFDSGLSWSYSGVVEMSYMPSPLYNQALNQLPGYPPNMGINNAYAQNLVQTPAINRQNNCKILNQRNNIEPLRFAKNQISVEDLKNLTQHMNQHQKFERINSESDKLTQSRSGSFSSNSSNNNCQNNGNAVPQVTSSSRYKTELCRPFEESGSCKYGDKCQFAHGFEELRTLQRHPKYKTELCRTFHTAGFCPYGPRCHFIHNREDQIKTKANRPRNSTFGSTGEAAISPPISGDEDNISPFNNNNYEEDRFQFPTNAEIMAFSNYGDSPPSMSTLNSLKLGNMGTTNLITLLPELGYDLEDDSAFTSNSLFMHANLNRRMSDFDLPTASCSKAVQDQSSNARLSIFNSMVGFTCPLSS